MLTLLQRMDDMAPASPARTAVEDPVQPSRPSITILADAQEEEARALEDWSRGLDWVHWMFSGVRARQDQLLFVPKATKRAAIGLEWDGFAEEAVRNRLGPQLVQAWQAAQAGDAAALIAADIACSRTLPEAAFKRSTAAGNVLLHDTRGARYQGVLGHYRSAHAAGQTPGHFIIVWAAVGHFFQLSLANVIAEYLRLEWDMATRHLHHPGDPVGRHSIAGLTTQLMHAPGSHELRLMKHAP